MTTLSDVELRAGLAGLPGWALDGARITREYRLADFRRAVAFVVDISHPAEAADHHPDLDIRYNRVLVSLSTHSQGGITAKDFDLARTIDSLFGRGDVRDG